MITHSTTGTGVDVSPALLTLEQSAKYIGAATVWAVRRLIYAGKLPYVKVGKRFNIPKASLDKWIEKNTQREGVARA